MTNSSAKPIGNELLAFRSSSNPVAWAPRPDPLLAREWWYFDALAAEGDEGLMVMFLRDYGVQHPHGTSDRYSGTGTSLSAVSFTYFRGGRTVCQSKIEYLREPLNADPEFWGCRVGESSFFFQSAPYGSGYLVSVAETLDGGGRVEAALEWLSVESDLRPDAVETPPRGHLWNMAAPRADVTGCIRVFDRAGSETEEIHFRGTGYHDHHFDNGYLTETVRDWQWGRAHFADATAVFCRVCEGGPENRVTKLMIIRNGELSESVLRQADDGLAREPSSGRRFGRIEMRSESGIVFEVGPTAPIGRGPLGEVSLVKMVLCLPGGTLHETSGIAESMNQRVTKRRWLPCFERLFGVRDRR